MGHYHAYGAICDHRGCAKNIADMDDLSSMREFGWWISEDPEDILEGKSALCPDHAPEE